MLRIPRATGNETRGKCYVVKARPAPESKRTGDRVEGNDVSRGFGRDRVENLVARIESVLLHGKTKAVDPGLSRFFGLRAVRDEGANRLRVVDELLAGHLAALEEPPPHRSRLAPVILEEIARQYEGRIAGVDQRS